MGEGAAAFQFGPAEARRLGIEPNELREALGLVQESMIKLLRFQLALERRDRRVALETMDDVVLLERRLNAIVTRLPASPAESEAGAAELSRQRRQLAQEKFTLAAGAAAPGRTSGPDWSEPAAAVPEADSPAADAAAARPDELLLLDPIAEEAPSRAGRLARIGAWLVIAGGALAGGLALIGPAEIHSWLGGWLG